MLLHCMQRCRPGPGQGGCMGKKQGGSSTFRARLGQRPWPGEGTGVTEAGRAASGGEGRASAAIPCTRIISTPHPLPPPPCSSGERHPCVSVCPPPPCPPSLAPRGHPEMAKVGGAQADGITGPACRQPKARTNRAFFVDRLFILKVECPRKEGRDRTKNLFYLCSLSRCPPRPGWARAKAWG